MANNIHIDIDSILDVKVLKKEVEEKIIEKYKRTIDPLLNNFFTNGQWGTAKGPGYIIIEQKLAEAFDGEKIQERMESYLEEHSERLFNEAMEKAAKRAFEHKANKIVFAKEGIKRQDLK